MGVVIGNWLWVIGEYNPSQISARFVTGYRNKFSKIGLNST